MGNVGMKESCLSAMSREYADKGRYHSRVTVRYVTITALGHITAIGQPKVPIWW